MLTPLATRWHMGIPLPLSQFQPSCKHILATTEKKSAQIMQESLTYVSYIVVAQLIFLDVLLGTTCRFFPSISVLR